MHDLSEFWDSQHRGRDQQWLTGTTWASIQTLYGLTPADFKDKICLEIGVGRVTVTPILADLAKTLYACDISEAALVKAAPHAQTFLSRNIHQIPALDRVLCHLVFVHCDDEECLRILKSLRLREQGRVYCQFSCLKNAATGISDAASRVQTLLDIGVKHFFRTPEQIKHLVASAGLEVNRAKDVDPGSFHGWTGQYWQILELCK